MRVWCRFMTAVLLLVFMLAIPHAPALAQDYPTRPVRIITELGARQRASRSGFCGCVACTG